MNHNLDSYIESIYAEFQPYSKRIVFGDDLEINITDRILCKNDTPITIDSYVDIENKTYKVISLNKWNDYMEVYLYNLKRYVQRFGKVII